RRRVVLGRLGSGVGGRARAGRQPPSGAGCSGGGSGGRIGGGLRLGGSGCAGVRGGIIAGLLVGGLARGERTRADSSGRRGACCRSRARDTPRPFLGRLPRGGARGRRLVLAIATEQPPQAALAAGARRFGGLLGASAGRCLRGGPSPGRR